MDKASEIYREPPRTGPSFRDLVGPLLGLFGAAVFLTGIVYAIIWLTSI